MLCGVIPNGSRLSRKASPRPWPSGVPAANCRAEASKFKGDGWRAYDATFRQNMAARASGLSWSQVDAGLHANSRGTLAQWLAVHHIEAYHVAQDCALQLTASARVKYESASGKVFSRPTPNSGRASSGHPRQSHTE